MFFISVGIATEDGDAKSYWGGDLYSFDFLQAANVTIKRDTTRYWKNVG